MISPLDDYALRTALHERAIYRAMSQAALDQLHAAQIEIERQRRQIAELREELKERMHG